jgi:2-keto-myo-inositol isomerase
MCVVKLCINQVTFGKRPFPKVVAACAASQFEAIELWLPYVEQFLAQGHPVEEVRALLGDAGVAPVSACYVDGLFGPAGDGKRGAFDRARRRFELCGELGVSTIACVAGDTKEDQRDAFRHAVERAREVGELAASFGLVVAIEFIARRTVIGTLSAAARLVEEVDRTNVGVLLDVFHFHAGESALDDFGELGRRGVVMVHLNDAEDVPGRELRDCHRVLPGDGCVPLDDVLARLQESGYDGYYSLELFNPTLWAEEPAAVAAMARAACQGLEA